MAVGGAIGYITCYRGRLRVYLMLKVALKRLPYIIGDGNEFTSWL